MRRGCGGRILILLLLVAGTLAVAHVAGIYFGLPGLIGAVVVGTLITAAALRI